MNWRDIQEYEGLYQVSDCGQVKSCERVRGNGKGYVQKERILKLKLTVCGYHYVSLCKDGVKKNFRVHRLVALAFIEGDHSLTVNHIDECKTNNHVSNLEYLTQGDNLRAWSKNNPGHRAKWIKKAQEVHRQQVLDTQTGRIFPSIKAAGLYMFEKENAKGPTTWFDKIRKGKQDRFKLYRKSESDDNE